MMRLSIGKKLFIIILSIAVIGTAIVFSFHSNNKNKDLQNVSLKEKMINDFVLALQQRNLDILSDIINGFTLPQDISDFYDENILSNSLCFDNESYSVTEIEKDSDKYLFTVTIKDFSKALELSLNDFSQFLKDHNSLIETSEDEPLMSADDKKDKLLADIKENFTLSSDTVLVEISFDLVSDGEDNYKISSVSDDINILLLGNLTTDDVKKFEEIFNSLNDDERHTSNTTNVSPQWSLDDFETLGQAISAGYFGFAPRIPYLGDRFNLEELKDTWYNGNIYIDKRNFPLLNTDIPYCIEYSSFGLYYLCEKCNNAYNDSSALEQHYCCEVYGHEFQPKYKTVHVPEEGHYETVLVSEAYDETIYVYSYICNECGAVFTSSDECYNHSLSSHGEDKGFQQSCSENIAHHDAVYNNVWIVDKEGYDVQELDYYICLHCRECKDK